MRYDEDADMCTEEPVGGFDEPAGWFMTGLVSWAAVLLSGWAMLRFGITWPLAAVGCAGLAVGLFWAARTVAQSRRAGALRSEAGTDPAPTFLALMLTLAALVVVVPDWAAGRFTWRSNCCAGFVLLMLGGWIAERTEDRRWERRYLAMSPEEKAEEMRRVEERYGL